MFCVIGDLKCKFPFVNTIVNLTVSYKKQQQKSSNYISHFLIRTTMIKWKTLSGVASGLCSWSASTSKRRHSPSGATPSCPSWAWRSTTCSETYRMVDAWSSCSSWSRARSLANRTRANSRLDDQFVKVFVLSQERPVFIKMGISQFWSDLSGPILCKHNSCINTLCN